MKENLRHTRRESRRNFLKRRSVADGLAMVDAAHLATYRLYCDSLALWRRCRRFSRRRHRRCGGEPAQCLIRGLPFVPPAERVEAQRQVITGGPRRLPPASHMEWQLRRTALATLVSWRMSRSG